MTDIATRAERGDDAGRELYLSHTSNDPFMHCNRFLLWDELSVEEQAKWNTRAAIARSMEHGD